MSKSKNVSISKTYLFESASYYYDCYAQTREPVSYGRYCELRDIMQELNLSQDYIKYRFGKRR